MRKRTPSPSEIGKLGEQMNGLKLGMPPTFAKLQRKLQAPNNKKTKEEEK